MGTGNIISVRNLTKSYKMGDIEVNAVNNVSFDIADGEFAAILGPSGSGKSTILNITGGMDKPTSGEVYVEGVNIAGCSEDELTYFRRDKVGFVFQFYNLMPDLTAGENVELAAEVCKNPLDGHKLLDEVGLQDRKDYFPSQMSGGQQQRVAIARALAKNPAILLCDEPTGALDYATGKLILSVLHNVNKKFHKTVVIITHNNAIGEMADKVIRLRSGEIEDILINSNPKNPEEIEW
jgi:ABC-type antimicrobial peptide transport system, ATPase component